MEMMATQSDRIDRAEHTILSERDTLLVLDLLENPPPLSSKLVSAAKAWIDNQKKLEWEIGANRG